MVEVPAQPPVTQPPVSRRIRLVIAGLILVGVSTASLLVKDLLRYDLGMAEPVADLGWVALSAVLIARWAPLVSYRRRDALWCLPGGRWRRFSEERCRPGGPVAPVA